MTLNTVSNVARKVALGLAVTGATAFQAGGCQVNIDGEDLLGLVEGVLNQIPDMGGGWDEPTGWDDPWYSPIDGGAPQFDYPSSPGYCDYSNCY